MALVAPWWDASLPPGPKSRCGTCALVRRSRPRTNWRVVAPSVAMTVAPEIRRYTFSRGVRKSLLQLLEGADECLGASGDIAKFPFKCPSFIQNDDGRKSGHFKFCFERLVLLLDDT